MRSIYVLVFSLCLVSSAFAGKESESELVFKAPWVEYAKSLAELEGDIEGREINIYDAMHKKQKRYRSLPLREVLTYAFGEDYASQEVNAVEFMALDGYKTVASMSRIENQEAHLVFHDLDNENWEKIKNANPGPFYLVWEGKKQLPKNGYPWPWQIKQISLISLEGYYATPADELKLDQPAQAGFELFNRQCRSCHAIDKVGGTVGPDLGAPRPILSYRSAEKLRLFIKSPSSFRYSKMPDFNHLSESDLDSIISYFKALNNN